MNAPVTRRHFLAVSGAAAAAVPRAMASQGHTATRVGIIGFGQRGEELTREFARRDCRISAVADVSTANRDRARTLTGADVCAEWKALLDRDDVDAVVVATPDYLHAPMTIAALRVGKDVYCETPMTRTLDEARAVRDTAAATGRILQIGATGLASGPWETVRETVANGRLGELYWCQSSCPLQMSGESWRGSWETSGGIASDVVFDRVASMMTGLGLRVPDRVSVAGGVYARGAREVPDSFVLTLEYERGTKIVLTSANAHGNGAVTVLRGREARLHLTENSVVAEAEPGYERAFARRFGTGPRVVLTPARSFDLLDNWIESIRSRQAAACGPETAYPVMVAAAMANEAYRSKRAVAFDAGTGCIGMAPVRC